jgi:DNA-binding Lrp family transcriptional regulator
LPTAYVFINCRLGKESEIINKVRDIRGVEEANGVYGLYDVITRISTDTEEGLEDVLRKVRRIENILSTNTLIKIEEQGWASGHRP